ncbi:hypothetical protein B9Z65_1255 [Elsinoe australis]|uniref:F-box domain-containing protein n=1 Tax=Elsinoe australis TaxID=40998 RepID=A0A2P7YQ23_9PEZI|nr:hypothetical protein B9Z65_1255 [Elsinoe australis]
MATESVKAIHDLSTNPAISRIRIHITTPHAPLHNLGTLSALPPELISQIIPHLDLLTISRLRRVNRFSLHLLNTLPLFRTLLDDHPTVLRAIYATRAGHLITLSQLHTTLLSTSCCHPTCNQTDPSASPISGPPPDPASPDPIPTPSQLQPQKATHLYLPLCRPLCHQCLLQSPLYLPLGLLTTGRSYGLPTPVVESLPHLFSVPGTYGVGQGTYEGKVTRLVDVGSAERKAVEYHGSLARMQRFVNHDRDLRWGAESVYGAGGTEARRWMGVVRLEKVGRGEGGARGDGWGGV